MEIQEHIFHTGTVALNYAEVIAPGAPLAPLVMLHGGNARWFPPCSMTMAPAAASTRRRIIEIWNSRGTIAYG